MVGLLFWLGLDGKTAGAASDPRIVVQPVGGSAKAGEDFGFNVLPGGTPPFAYQWFFKGTFPTSQTNRALVGQTNLILWLTNVTETNQGAYSVEVRNEKGTNRSKSVSLTVKDPVIVVQPLGGRVVAGANFTNQVVAAGLEPLTYQWYLKKGGKTKLLEGETSRTLVLENLSSAQSGSYSVRVTNLAGKVSSSGGKLTVVDLAIDAQPKGGTVNACQAFRFTVNAFGTPPLAYQWFLNDLPLAKETNSVLCLTNVMPAQAGSYRVVVSNATTNKTSAHATLKVRHPVIVGQPQDAMVPAGSNFCFVVEACGDETLTYQWFFGKEALPGETNSVLCFTNVTPAQSGAYSVVVHDTAGGVRSDTATLAVHELAILGQPQGGIVPACADFCFAVEAFGIEPVSYQWFFEPSFPSGQAAVPLDGETNRLLCLSNVLSAQSGAYYVEVSNLVLTNISTNAILSVLDPAIITQPQGGRVVAGSDFCFTVEACGTEPMSYQWFYNATRLVGAVNRTLCLNNVTPSQSGAYSVLVSGPFGSVMSATTNLTVLDLTIVTPPRSGSVLAGSNFCFSVEAVGGAPLSYQWFFNGAILPGATDRILCLTNVTSDQSGQYQVRVMNPFAALETPTARLTVYDLAILQQPHDGEVLVGDDFTNEVVVAGQGPFAFQWLFKDGVELLDQTNCTLVLSNVTRDQTGPYAVRISNAGGSLLSASANLTVHDLVILREPESASVLAGTNYCFEVVASGTPPFTYQWFTNGVVLTNATNSTLCLEYVTKAQSGTYSVLVSNGAGGSLRSEAKLAVTDPVIWIQPVGGWVTTNSDFRFEVVAEGTQPLVYQWYFKKKALAGEIGRVLELKNITASQGGSYYVKVRNAAGSVKSATANLSVLTGPARFIRSGAFTTNGASGQAQLQLLLQGNGEENALSFSMSYDPDILIPSLTPGDPRPVFVPATNLNATVTTTNTTLITTNEVVTWTSVCEFLITTNMVTNTLVGVTMQLEPGRTFLRTNAQVVGALQFDVVGTTNPLLGRLAFASQPVPVAAADVQGRALGMGAELAPSGIVVEEDPELHEQSGLFRQHLLLSNPTAVQFSDIKVTVYGLNLDSDGKKIPLYNAHEEGSIDANQDGLAKEPAYFVSVASPTNGQSVRLTMEYYVPDHRTLPRPFYTCSFASLPDLVVPKTEGIRIRAKSYVNGEFQLEFLTEEKRTYYVQYADTPEGLNDPDTRQISNPPIAGTGTALLWIDTGPPRTQSVPVPGMRYYRVRATWPR
jgi:hypothetical protein